MQEPYGEGLASHTDPESCVASREAGREALTGAHVGGVLSREIPGNQDADAVYSAEGNTCGRAIASTHRTCEVEDPRHPWNLHAREPGGPARARHEAVSGPVEEGDGHNLDMNAGGESQGCVVPAKCLNKGGSSTSAEGMEGRQPTKENTGQTAESQMQSLGERVSWPEPCAESRKEGEAITIHRAFARCLGLGRARDSATETKARGLGAPE